MAAVITHKQPALHFPHNLLHDNRELQPFSKMDRHVPTKLSLPPISSLMKDIDRQTVKSPATPPPTDLKRKMSPDSHLAHPRSPERLSAAGSPRSALPPNSPLPGPSSFDFGRQNGGGSLYNGYHGGSPASSNPELYTQHRSSYPPLPETSHWSSPNSPGTRRASDEVLSLRHKVNTGTHRSSYPELADTKSASGLAQQRPLPTFPGPLTPSSPVLPSIDPQMNNSPFQQQQQHHHHSYPLANSPGYPQSTDRYQCPTCQKAFSRPSSLKIHTYSHTGEKPFKCKYEGCGKFFSVRSNMKRHEKGCHGAETSSVGSNSPKAS